MVMSFHSRGSPRLFLVLLLVLGLFSWHASAATLSIASPSSGTVIFPGESVSLVGSTSASSYSYLGVTIGGVEKSVHCIASNQNTTVVARTPIATSFASAINVQVRPS